MVAVFSGKLFKARPKSSSNLLWVRADYGSYSVGSPIVEVCCLFISKASSDVETTTSMTHPVFKVVMLASLES